MKYIIAVSGGVDSVVLLDMLSKNARAEDAYIVAHFDHGIRKDSQEDAVFVRELARKYGHDFIMQREELGADASEAVARDRRYKFLQDAARQHKAQLITAHHLDDLIETVAINLTRGTGWRGLAVFHPSIHRPLIDMPKQTLLDYATEHALPWREDSTNASDKYLRNRLRRKTATLTEDEKRQLRALHARQREVRQEITKELMKLVGTGPEYSRYLFVHVPVSVAVEALRLVTGKKLTRPQLERLLHAIKTHAAGTKYEAGEGITVHFSTRNFTL